MAAGAMYRPLLDMVPVAGEMDHVTAVLLVPETVALNCCVAPAYRLADVGLSLMDTTGRGAAFTFRVRLVGCASEDQPHPREPMPQVRQRGDEHVEFLVDAVLRHAED
jgi:hypothetical protein